MFAPPVSQPPSKADRPAAGRAPAWSAAVRPALAGGGRPLDPASLARFESSFAFDFSDVRVHSGDRAAAAARSLSARAFAVGPHIVFGRGEYAPETAAGRHVLGHELAHVVQQSRGGSTAAGAPGLDASASRAAAGAARGERTIVAGASAPGIARLALPGGPGDGYDWPALRERIAGVEPVEAIVAAINASPGKDRDQALADITRERIAKARDLEMDAGGQGVPDAGPKLYVRRLDEVLDGVFAAIANSETSASLEAVSPATASTEEVESAIRPEVRAPGGGMTTFEERLAGDPESYSDKLMKEMLLIIERKYEHLAKDRGKEEHADPTKLHQMSELERVGKASKRETDNVFGGYKTGPAFRASGLRRNIADLWRHENRRINFPLYNRKGAARHLIRYFFITESTIAAINRAHKANPLPGDGSNQEARDQEQVTRKLTKSREDVRRLNEIQRGWDAEARGGRIFVQRFKAPDKAEGELKGQNIPDREKMWDTFQLFIHEYIHTLEHIDYHDYAEEFGDSSASYNTLVEGVATLLDEIVWSRVAPRVAEPALREEVEGPGEIDKPALASVDPPSLHRRYPSYAEAIKLVSLVGIRNLYAAFFLGEVDRIAGQEKGGK